MKPANVIRLSHAEAMRVGVTMGADAARGGANPQDVIDVVCGRLFWRIQEDTVRRAFACAFALAFEETERRAG